MAKNNAEENMAEENKTEEKAAEQRGSAPDGYEPLTVTYERLRACENSAELDEFAMRELPDRSDAAAFSRATALLEAVAGNSHTSVEKRIYLAKNMGFPNILVKLSQDADPQVRAAVASNEEVKNWLVGRLTKDESAQVRSAALRNKQTSWKMRLEGAQNEETDAETLDFLASFGAGDDEKDCVQAIMVRRAVALNKNVSARTLEKMSADKASDVVKAVESRKNNE